MLREDIESNKMLQFKPEKSGKEASGNKQKSYKNCWDELKLINNHFTGMI